MSLTLSGITGVESHIKTYYPYVPGGGFSYAWVMLTAPANNEWAQIGPYRSAYGQSTTLQYMQPSWGSPYQYDFAATTEGSVHTYQVLYNGTDFGTTLDGTVNSDIHLSWAPSGAQIYDEIVSLQNQMMGDSSTKENFATNRVRSYTYTWVNYWGTLSSPTTHFSDSGSATNFYVWDLCK